MDLKSNSLSGKIILMKVMPGYSKKFKKYVLFASIGVLAIVIPVILFQVFGKKDAAEAAWFNDSWSYRAAITFGNTGSAQSFKKVNFTINTSAPINSNQMQSDCGDSRFTDSSGQLLRYYIASGCNTTTTQYWVLIPTIAAGTNFVHHYYGNPSAINWTENAQFSEATFSPTSGPTVAAQETGQGPIGYWSLDDVTDSTIRDSTLNANNLTLISGGLDLGDGADGAKTVSTSDTTSFTSIAINTISGSGQADADRVEVGSTSGVSAGDELLVIQIIGTGEGNYEFCDVQSVVTNDYFDCSSNLSNTYQATGAQVVRIPNWTNVTIQSGGVLTTLPWNGSSGGVVAFRATGTVDVQSGGAIDTNGLGFSTSGPGSGGGSGGGAAAGTATAGAGKGGGGGGGGGQGGSYGTAGSTPLGGGGGGGGENCTCGSGTVTGGGGGDGTGAIGANASGTTDSASGGGGGGGNTGNGGVGGSGSGGGGSGGTGGSTNGGSSGGGAGGDGSGTGGANGSNGSDGATDGTTYGAASLSTIFLGSNGGNGGSGAIGGGNTNPPVSGGAGGAGGGIIIISGNTVQVTATGAITTTGNVGVGGTVGKNGVNNTGANGGSGGGGGGSGGSILISGSAITLGSSLVIATGGAGGSHGNGGDGSIAPGGSGPGQGGVGASSSSNDRGGGGGAGGAGTNGGVGRIHIDYLSTPSGTASPAADTAQITTSVAPTVATEDMCISGKCLAFSSGYASKTYSSDTELNPGTSSFTVSAWFKHTSNLSGTDYLLSRYAGSGWQIYDSSAGFCFGIDDDGTFGPDDDACTTTTYADSQWHYLTAVKNGTTNIQLYIDGRLVDTQTSLNATATLNGTSPALRLGTDGPATSGNTWDGFIDEVKYYNFAKTASQIKSDFASRGSSNGVATQFGNPDLGKTLSNGLVRYYKMNESLWTADCATETVMDSSGNNKNLKSCPITTGSTGYGIGKFGRAGVFDGNDDYVEGVGISLPTGKPFTISLWVKSGNWPVTYPLTFTEPGSQNVYSLSFSGGGNVIISYNNAGQGKLRTASDYAITDAVLYHHIVGTFDGTRARAYVDNNEVTLGTESNSTTNQADCLRMGRPCYSSSSYLPGNIFEARVYNRALSPGEVSALYNWAPGPIAWWKMDENTGTAANDSSGNGFNGTWAGSGITHWTPGKLGSAGNFNGSDDQINTPDISTSLNLKSTTPPSFSVEAWFYKSDTSGGDLGGVILTTPTANGNTRLLYRPNTNISFQMKAGSTEITQASPVGSWYHAAGVYDRDANTIKLYVNGTLVGTTSPVDRDLSSGFSTTNVTIGNAQNNYKGMIDDVRIYNYARTPSQILQDMNAGHPLGGSPVASQTLYWEFDEMTGTSAFNSNSIQPTLKGTLGTGNSSPTWLTGLSCVINGCISMDAAQDYITAGDVSFTDSLTQMTVSFWINPLTLATNRSIISKNAASQKNFAIVTDASNSDEIRVHVAASTGEADNTTYFTTSNLDLSASSWQHVLVVYDGTQSAPSSRVRVYKNGREVSGSATGTLPATMTTGSTSTLRVGNDDSTTYTALVDRIDEVKIYTAALTNSELLVDFNGGGALGLGGGVKTTHNNEGFMGTGPVGWWKLDDNTGTTPIDSSATNGGTSGSLSFIATPTWVPGKEGSALEFDGSTQGLVSGSGITSLQITGDVTVATWLKANSFDISDAIVLMRGETDDESNNQNFSIETSDGAAGGANDIFYEHESGAGVNTERTWDTNLATGRWYHVAIVRDATAKTVSLYLDGALFSTQSYTSAPTGGTVGILHVAQSTSASRYFDGKLDDIRVYNYALSAAQISYIYNRGGPVGYWEFDECEGSVAHDSSVNAADGNISIGGTAPQTSTGTCNSGTSTEAWNNGTSGKFSSSISLDGVDDIITVSKSAPLNLSGGWSISVWIYKTAFTGGIENIVSKGRSSINYFLDLTSSGIIELGTSGSQIVSTAALSLSQWHHVVGTTSSAGVSNIYIDGKLDKTGSQTLVGSNSDPLDIASYQGTSEFFKGLLDDLRIYSYDLTAAQVQKLYNEGGAQRFGP